MRRDYDVIVAGGGMVGVSMALALAPLGLTIALVDRVPVATRKAPGYDDRSTALAEGSRRILASFGVWESLAPDAAPIRRVHVSEVGRFGVTKLDAADVALDALGWVVENPRLEAALDEAVAACDSVERLQPATLVGLADDGERVTVEVDRDGAMQTLTARLLVAADGARSGVRDLLGITASVREYGQTAIVANVSPRDDHGGTAWERFSPDGPLAVLPLSGGRCALVWTLPARDADAALTISDDAFAARIHQMFGDRLGPLVRVGRRQAWPLARVIAREQSRGRVALVGNAAHSLHPIAAQGLNLSLRDLAALAETVAAGLAAGGDPADGAALAQWIAGRRADQARVTSFIDVLNGVFTNGAPGLGPLRGSALAALGLAGGGRRLLARYGAGIGAPLPKLARGIPLA